MSAPPGVVIIPPGWVRCVVTNVGPTLVQIFPSGCRRGGRSGAVEGGAVRADPAGPATGGPVDPRAGRPSWCPSADSAAGAGCGGAAATHDRSTTATAGD